ncbi:unnamed protein product [Cyprideis torosa]|uniref:Uncharacterized protein n=1 Tax=Cyprideis torosa TaxID=163714 RepID=A0A7R8ZTU2_9CRUS|nr:unnamed protein product [Cyprideis torosa]CAG0898901.1 unnamed protein product [Cyprideis torosa]
MSGDENSSSPLLKDVKAALNIKDEFCDPHNSSNCFYYNSQIRHDLLPFQQGIARDVIEDARSQGVTYKLIDHQLYREKTCTFPARCEGVEYFLLRLAAELPDLEFVLNDYDWPRVHVNTRRKAKVETSPLPVFSFSKTLDYHDIIYPAWSFWAGGPAISLYPKGIGRWNQLREQITESSKEFPWEKKKSIG